MHSAKPKEAVVQQELLEFMSHEAHREEACRIRDDLDGVVGGELIVVLHKCFPASLTKKEDTPPDPLSRSRAFQEPCSVKPQLFFYKIASQPVLTATDLSLLCSSRFAAGR